MREAVAWLNFAEPLWPVPSSMVAAKSVLPFLKPVKEIRFGVSVRGRNIDLERERREGTRK